MLFEYQCQIFVRQREEDEIEEEEDQGWGQHEKHLLLKIQRIPMTVVLKQPKRGLFVIYHLLSWSIPLQNRSNVRIAQM
jgi:hypothetical protein